MPMPRAWGGQPLQGFAVEHDACPAGARQAGDGGQDAGFSGAGGAEQGNDAGGRGFEGDVEGEIAAGVGDRDGEAHPRRPRRAAMPILAARNSEAARPAMARVMENSARRAASASPSGFSSALKMASGKVWVCPGMLAAKVMTAPNSPRQTV